MLMEQERSEKEKNAECRRRNFSCTDKAKSASLYMILFMQNAAMDFLTSREGLIQIQPPSSALHLVPLLQFSAPHYSTWLHHSTLSLTLCWKKQSSSAVS